MAEKTNDYMPRRFNRKPDNSVGASTAYADGRPWRSSEKAHSVGNVSQGGRRGVKVIVGRNIGTAGDKMPPTRNARTGFVASSEDSFKKGNFSNKIGGATIDPSETIKDRAQKYYENIAVEPVQPTKKPMRTV